MALDNIYTAGTVSVDNASTTVTGTGTLWGGDAIMPGDLFCDPAQPAIPPQRVKSVTSDTELELWAPWPGTTMEDDEYEIRFVGIIERSTAQTRRVLEQLGEVSAYYDVQVDTLADRDAFDARPAGFRVLVSDIGDGRAAIYSKASSVEADWTDPAMFSGPIGLTPEVTVGAVTTGDPGTEADVTATPVEGGVELDFTIPAGEGFSPEGDYDGGTAYVKGDVVQYQGSSWIALQETTGNTPPSLPTTSNTYWQLIARAGTDGAGTVTTITAGDGIAVDLTDPTDPVISATATGVNRNYLVNSDWSINQEVIDLSGGVTLAQGEYFRDRWSATSGGADLTFDGTTATLDGAIGTVIEGQSWAGRDVTFSLENPDGDVHVGISAFESGSGSVNGTITAGSGQRSVTLTVPATATGSLVLELATTEAVDFDVRMKLEVGTRATLWEPPDELELQRCQKHWCKSLSYETAIADPIGDTTDAQVYLGACYNASGMTDCPQSLPLEMRAVPDITLLGTTDAGQWKYYPGSGSWVSVASTLSRVTKTKFTVRVDIDALSFKDAVFFRGHWTADARPDMSTVNSSWVGLL